MIEPQIMGFRPLFMQPSPPKVRRPERSCLHKALGDLSGPDVWTLEADCLDPVSLRVVGDADFAHWQHAGPHRDRRKTASTAITKAIASAAEHMSPRLLDMMIGRRHRRGDLDPGSLPRLLKPFRDRILIEVRATIDAGGYDAITALAEGERHPALIRVVVVSDVHLSPDELEALCQVQTTSAIEDPLRRGWETLDIPGDRALKTAVKYVFGQGWKIDADMFGGVSLSIRKSYRFAPYLAGDHLDGEVEIARTAVFRAVAEIIPGSGEELLARLVPEAEGQSFQPEDIDVLLDDVQARLKGVLLDAIENEGYEGLVRTVRELGG